MQDLRDFLNQLQKDYHQKKFLSSDPLEFVHHFQDPWDQEAIALLSALLAYGNVTQIRKSVKEAMLRIHQISRGPGDFTRKLQSSQFLKQAQIQFQGYVHRFNPGEDLVQLFWLLGKSWSEYGSLGAHFLTYLHPNDPDFSPALNSLIGCWKKWLKPQTAPTVAYFLTAPSSGSCCKRWCMFLRWMGRKDRLDPGLWGKNSPLFPSFPQGRYLKPSQLVMPLDTHTGRISQYLGLTHRKSLNWKAALEVTHSLKNLDPDDPTRYDFALSRLGILDICKRSYRKEICQKCQLLPACRFARKYSNGASLSMQCSV